MKKTIETQTQFLLRAVPEAQYFADQSLSSVFLKAAGTLISVQNSNSMIATCTQ